MSEWQVHLEFEDGSSAKFWRARVEAKTLYVNYGKIGSDGQTQVKDLGSPDAAKKEIEKLEREKRKKGYVDAGGGGGGEDADDDEEDDEDEDEEEEEEEEEKPAPKQAAAKSAGASTKLTMSAKGRKLATTLSLDGATVRMDALETYSTPDAAKQAYYRLLAQLLGEGYSES